MIIHVLRQPLAEIQSPWLVLLLLEEHGDLPAEVRDTALGGLAEPADRPERAYRLGGRIDRRSWTGRIRRGFAADRGPRPGQQASMRARPTQRVLPCPSGLRASLVNALRWLFPNAIDRSVAGWISALIAGVVAGTRGPGLRKTEPNRHPFENPQRRRRPRCDRGIAP